jgi:hypothetical protein
MRLKNPLRPASGWLQERIGGSDRGGRGRVATRRNVDRRRRANEMPAGTTRPVEAWGRRPYGKRRDAQPDTCWRGRPFPFRYGGAEP